MGCSPSKGNNFGTLASMRRGRMLPPALQDSLRHSKLGEGERCHSTESTDGNPREGKVVGQTCVTELSPEAVNVNRLDSQELVKPTVLQRKEKNFDKQDVIDKKSVRKVKKNTKGTKVFKKKDKEKQAKDVKVDFPEPLVKAHQAAYAFLNPSIHKYDGLLGLLEEATHTQVSVQPMVAFMTLRYEEIIQGMNEMAGEGEKVLKENGEHLAWPSQMKNLSSSSPLKCGSDNIEPPPDLLQQLLQYTTQRMQNVCQTVSGIGDSALEEAVEYFASVSELLEEKLKVKRAVENRLMQLLSRIEMASLHKPGPDDSALFSEDSGIGAESESLAGSETRHRRQSCESIGTNRTTPVSPLGYKTSRNVRKRLSSRKILSEISPSVSLTSLNSLDSTCTILANDQRDSVLGSVSLDDGEEDNNENDEEIDRGMGDVKVRFRQRSNSSPVDHEQNHPCRLPPKRIENPQNVEMTLKMKNAISGRIQFVPSQNSSTKAKVLSSPKTNKRQWTDDEKQSPRRPQTATNIQKSVVKKTVVAKERRTQSAESLRSKGEDPTLLELERTQRDLDQRLQRMNKNKQGSTRTSIAKQKVTSPAQSPSLNRKLLPTEKNNNPQPPKDKACHNKSNNKKQEGESNEEGNKQKDNKTPKGPIRATPPPSPPLSPRLSTGFYRGRNSVKKLIDTFSQGIEELDGPKVLGPLKGVRKCGVPVLPGLGNVEAVLSTGISSCRPESISCEKKQYLDLDSLPPPPLEVLMDNSFEGALCSPTGTAEDGTKGGKPFVSKRAVVSQRLRASVQSVSVLPSKGGLPQASALSKVNKPEVPTQTLEEPRKEKNLVHYLARKMIHPKQGSDSELETLPINKSTDIQDGVNLSVSGPSTIQSTVPPSSVVTNQPPVTPLLSRSRMLPSTPSTSSSSHRSLPSPESCKRQPTPPSSNRTSFNRRLPTPPSAQRQLPSPPTAKQNLSDSKPVSIYPFKAPSPPASPKVQRWSRENSSEDSSSARTMSNAQSVFCPSSPSLFEAQPCSVPQPTQAWTSSRVSFLSRTFGNRGRVPLPIQGPRPFIRRSHSDRRPSVSQPQKSPGISVAETCGSEPAICSKMLDDDPTRDEELWDGQSDLRATPRSASHPDLCVVGYALYRD
ncbi:photoreceptor cilium actin regulator [Betta splendens]|uniref:Photoreceptor cilium actin regulator n=1 Tax=Betta splendens TaxID=158456 RepID=A0A6P7LJR6_BETSP|nr:photoreceptor cilium actin regulator [Betta splendens]